MNTLNLPAKRLKQFSDYKHDWLCVPKEFYNWLTDFGKPSSDLSRQNEENFYLEGTDGKEFLSKCFFEGIYITVETRYQHFNSGILNYATIDSEQEPCKESNSQQLPSEQTFQPSNEQDNS